MAHKGKGNKNSDITDRSKIFINPIKEENMKKGNKFDQKL